MYFFYYHHSFGAILICLDLQVKLNIWSLFLSEASYFSRYISQKIQHGQDFSSSETLRSVLCSASAPNPSGLNFKEQCFFFVFTPTFFSCASKQSGDYCNRKRCLQLIILLSIMHEVIYIMIHPFTWPLQGHFCSSSSSSSHLFSSSHLNLYFIPSMVVCTLDLIIAQVQISLMSLKSYSITQTSDDHLSRIVIEFVCSETKPRLPKSNSSAQGHVRARPCTCVLWRRANSMHARTYA